MFHLRPVLSVFLTLFLSACHATPQKSMNSKLDQLRANASAKIDQQKCKAQGGTVRSVGMMGMPSCVIPYADANKICSDSSECQGICTTEATTAGTAVTGKCSVNSASVFGCYSKVKDGKAEPGLCVD